MDRALSKLSRRPRGPRFESRRFHSFSLILISTRTDLQIDDVIGCWYSFSVVIVRRSQNFHFSIFSAQREEGRKFAKTLAAFSRISGPLVVGPPLPVGEMKASRRLFIVDDNSDDLRRTCGPEGSWDQNNKTSYAVIHNIEN